MFVLKNGTNPLHMPLDKGELGPGASVELTDDDAHAFLGFPGFCIALEAELCSLDEVKAQPITVPPPPPPVPTMDQPIPPAPKKSDKPAKPE